MKLDRNIPELNRGKYALIKLRVEKALTEPLVLDPRIIADRFEVLKTAVDFGNSDDTDFFVIRLKDKYAAPALAAYAMAAYRDDREYGMEMLNLAKKAAEYSEPRIPD